MIIFVTTSKVTEDSIVKTKENLEMLMAMFQSLRNAMNTEISSNCESEEDFKDKYIRCKSLTNLLKK